MRLGYTDESLGDLSHLPTRHADQIMRKIERLRTEWAGDIKALSHAEAGYRLRSGVYRVLFDCDGETITVRKIKHRRDAYR